MQQRFTAGNAQGMVEKGPVLLPGGQAADNGLKVDRIGNIFEIMAAWGGFDSKKGLWFKVGVTIEASQVTSSEAEKDLAPTNQDSLSLDR